MGKRIFMREMLLSQNGKGILQKGKAILICNIATSTMKFVAFNTPAYTKKEQEINAGDHNSAHILMKTSCKQTNYKI